ncbi:MAG: MATE family efflux transporter [Ignavibacteria bacterium]|jgi:putative MATE family efflux protein|nr:MATE family efflux transporter [Ignavibacteria bacterium]
MPEVDSREHLGVAPIPKLLREFSIPAVVGLLVNGMYNIVDRIFVGQGVGTLGIAGMTVGFPIILMTLGLTLLISVGANVTFGIRLGERKYDEAEEILGNSFVMMFIVAVVVSIICLVFLHPILSIFGASPEVLPYAADYLKVIMIGNVFGTMALGLNNLMRTAGAPKLSMLTQIIGSIVNAGLAPLFIFQFNMGIKGAAYATIIAQGISAIWCFAYFVLKSSPYRIRPKYFKLKAKLISGMCKLGMAPFSMQICSSIVNVILIKMLASYGGDTAISVIGLLISINSVVLFPIMGISQGMQPIISYNYGARNLVRILRAYRLALLVSTIYVTLGFLLLQIFPAQVISVFNSNDAELVKMGVHSIRIFSLFFPTVGFQIMTSIFFQATNRPTQSIVLGLSRQIIFLLPLISTLPFIFGFDGIIYSFPIADVLSTVLTFIFISKEMKIYKRQLRPYKRFIY